MKGNQRHWSNTLFRRKPLGEDWFKETRAGGVPRWEMIALCTPRSVWLPTADPLPISHPWPFRLPPSLLARKCQQLLRSAGCCVASLQHLGPPSSVCWAPLLHQRSHCSVVAGFFLTFLLVKSDFQMQEWNVSRKPWTQQPELRSWKKERYLKYISLPRTPLYKHINSHWMIKSFRILFFYSAPQALCFMFPIASPEINQSHTCSRPVGDGEDHPPCWQSQEWTAERA